MSTELTQEQGAWNQLASDPEILRDFILESMEHLCSIEAQLLILEQDPANAEAIHSIFRGFHTIKGLAGFLEIAAIQEVAHEVETVLDLARNFELAISAEVIDRILAGKDYLGAWVEALQRMLETGAQPRQPDNGPLIADIRSLLSNAGREAGLPVAVELPPEPEPAGLQNLSAAVMATPPAEQDRVERAVGTPVAEGRLVKVDTAKLDYLVDMVGEMVIAQSLVRHDPELQADSKPKLLRNLAQLARITEEVQKSAMSMRMVPVGHLFQKMARLVRDLAKKSGKEIELDMAGEDTELDRNIVEELSDPLMHMVRNACDHGVETPEERARAGKDTVAHLSLQAAHQAGFITIQLKDDGRGLDRVKIRAKAIQNGLISENQELSENEIFNLIFQPGFSTAEKVTDVSGRGVGMDVVRKNILKLRGKIEILSAPGQGTTFLLKLPLTLAIIDGLVVGVGHERYIVPIYAVREMLRPTEDMISTVQGRSEMALVRGSLLPVVRLHERFHVEPRSRNAWEALLIVSEYNGRRFCLQVDDMAGKQEVVIKSLGPTLQGIPGVAGGAILGDGRVGLILDLEGLFTSGTA